MTMLFDEKQCVMVNKVHQQEKYLPLRLVGIWKWHMLTEPLSAGIEYLGTIQVLEWIFIWFAWLYYWVPSNPEICVTTHSSVIDPKNKYSKLQTANKHGQPNHAQYDIEHRIKERLYYDQAGLHITVNQPAILHPLSTELDNEESTAYFLQLRLS